MTKKYKVYGMIVMTKTVYSKATIPAHRGNPLIECLPDLEDKELLKSWIQKPTLSPEEKSESNRYRRLSISSLDQTFNYPLQTYREFFNRLEEALLSSYAAKNPLDPSTIHFLHNLDYDDTILKPKGRFKPNGKAITLLGKSGVGKSTMIERTLGVFRQLYLHDEYQNKNLGGLKQITYLLVECPSSGSPKSLCIAILAELGRLAGLNKDEFLNTRLSREQLELLVEMRLREYFVGVLVIDEIQNLLQAKSGMADLLAFLLLLVNRSGVVLVFSGNEDARDIFTQKHRIGRRGEAGGVVEMQPLNKKSWQSVLAVLWRYQWLREETKLTQKIVDLFFSLTGGFIDQTIRVFQECQKVAIENGSEKITLENIKEAYEKACAFSHSYILSDSQEDIIESIFDEEDSYEHEASKPRAQNSEFPELDYLHTEFQINENFDLKPILISLDSNDSDFEQNLYKTGLVCTNLID